MSPFRHGDHGSHGNPAHAPMRDPVTGTALVVDINSFLDWQTSGHLELSYMFSGPLTATLVVQAEGVPKTTVQHAEQVPRGDDRIISRWPEQGDTVPVIIDRADPSRIQFQWDQMPTEQDRIAGMKQAQAKRLLERAYLEPPVKPHRPLP
jgi:hypothetical protein